MNITTILLIDAVKHSPYRSFSVSTTGICSAHAKGVSATFSSVEEFIGKFAGDEISEERANLLDKINTTL